MLQVSAHILSQLDDPEDRLAKRTQLAPLYVKTPSGVSF